MDITLPLPLPLFDFISRGNEELVPIHQIVGIIGFLALLTIGLVWIVCWYPRTYSRDLNRQQEARLEIRRGLGVAALGVAFGIAGLYLAAGLIVLIAGFLLFQVARLAYSVKTAAFPKS